MEVTARAEAPGLRQETQYTCMASSLASALISQGKEVTEADVNKVMGCGPMSGATWEDLLATAQYFGMRSTLVVPATVEMLRDWTSRGIPVVIAWNPEGRPWSHASVVVDVDGQDRVHIMDPNIPNPNKTFRVLELDDFYKKWVETIGDKMIVRRPAVAVEREVSREGRQMKASLQHQASSDAVRLAHVLKASEGNTVEELYLHLSNGGVTFQVEDLGRGPEVVLDLGSFGEMGSQIRFNTTEDALRDLAVLFLAASAHKGFSKPSEHGSPVTPNQKDSQSLRATFGLFQVMAEELVKVVEAYRGKPGLEKDLPEQLRSSGVSSGVVADPNTVAARYLDARAKRKNKPTSQKDKEKLPETPTRRDPHAQAAKARKTTPGHKRKERGRAVEKGHSRKPKHKGHRQWAASVDNVVDLYMSRQACGAGPCTCGGTCGCGAAQYPSDIPAVTEPVLADPNIIAARYLLRGD